MGSSWTDATLKKKKKAFHNESIPPNLIATVLKLQYCLVILSSHAADILPHLTLYYCMGIWHFAGHWSALNAVIFMKSFKRVLKRLCEEGACGAAAAALKDGRDDDAVIIA